MSQSHQSHTGQRHQHTNMRTNRKLLEKCKTIVSKYLRKRKQQQDLNESIELPENHFFNKMVLDNKMDLNKSTKLRKRVQNKKNNPKLLRKDTHTSTLHSQSGSHFYETICKNNTLHSMPSNLRILPLIPFWRSSFEIIGNQYSSAAGPGQAGLLRMSAQTSSLYVTMTGLGRDQTYTEPIYV